MEDVIKKTLALDDDKQRYRAIVKEYLSASNIGKKNLRKKYPKRKKIYDDLDN